jgi:hypothetical protein
MAKQTGLTKRQMQSADFRSGMAEHAAKLLISIALKKRARYDKRRETAVAVGAAEAKA